jgi:2-polyprenyl-3-methyl-5-hydroxy-6-metoxy-1,4-benzoquinol methylase
LPQVEEQPPKAIAIEGTHDFVLDLVKERKWPSDAVRVLDFGAGRGSMSYRLHKAGYTVHACDYYPDQFEVDEVECIHADAHSGLPYEDDVYDIVLAVELVEHIDDHTTFFTEVCRVLKPGGEFIFTTPNILSLKSRISFLFSGYFYSFKSLDPDVFDPVHQHISPFSIDRYRFILKRAGLTLSDIKTDKLQNSSRFWLILYPIIFLYRGKGKREEIQNSITALLGRKLAAVSIKPTLEESSNESNSS